MANKLYREEDVRAVAEAIRAKNESTETYTLSEMASAILAIETKTVAPLIVHSLVEDNGTFAKENFKSITIMAESVGNDAFYDCNNLESVEFVGVKSIGDNAFYYCTSLANVTIPDSVTSIGDRSFRGCQSLTTITIPDSVTSIADGAFNSCSALTSITLPNSITGTISNLFMGCNSLTEINYEGTIAEWQAIDTYGLVDWGKTVTVHCTDGDTTASQSGD